MEASIRTWDKVTKKNSNGIIEKVKKKKVKKLLKESKNCSNLEWNVQSETYLEVPALGIGRLEAMYV